MCRDNSPNRDELWGWMGWRLIRMYLLFTYWEVCTFLWTRTRVNLWYYRPHFAGMHYNDGKHLRPCLYETFEAQNLEKLRVAQDRREHGR